MRKILFFFRSRHIWQWKELLMLRHFLDKEGNYFMIDFSFSSAICKMQTKDYAKLWNDLKEPTKFSYSNLKVVGVENLKKVQRKIYSCETIITYLEVEPNELCKYHKVPNWLTSYKIFNGRCSACCQTKIETTSQHFYAWHLSRQTPQIVANFRLHDHNSGFSETMKLNIILSYSYGYHMNWIILLAALRCKYLL